MTDKKDLKIFISWSGTLAKEVTDVLRGWLPKMFDNVYPWASEVDIVPGMRGYDEIRTALNASEFGIIVITPENMEKPWLNFEAGALSKRLDGDPERVVPLLVNFESRYQLTTPVGQFQAVMLDEDGMRAVCKSIASSMGLSESNIQARFEWAWSDLAKSIEAAKERAGQQAKPPNLTDRDLLEKLIGQVDALQRAESQPQPFAGWKKAVRKTFSDAQVEAMHREVIRIASNYRQVLHSTVSYTPDTPGTPFPIVRLELEGPRLSTDEFEQITEECSRTGADIMIAG